MKRDVEQHGRPPPNVSEERAAKMIEAVRGAVVAIEALDGPLVFIAMVNLISNVVVDVAGCGVSGGNYRKVWGDLKGAVDANLSSFHESAEKSAKRRLN
jgi:hypothetical protein